MMHRLRMLTLALILAPNIFSCGPTEMQTRDEALSCINEQPTRKYINEQVNTALEIIQNNPQYEKTFRDNGVIRKTTYKPREGRDGIEFGFEQIETTFDQSENTFDISLPRREHPIMVNGVLLKPTIRDQIKVKNPEEDLVIYIEYLEFESNHHDNDPDKTRVAMVRHSFGSNKDDQNMTTLPYLEYLSYLQKGERPENQTFVIGPETTVPVTICFIGPQKPNDKRSPITLTSQQITDHQLNPETAVSEAQKTMFDTRVAIER